VTGQGEALPAGGRGGAGAAEPTPLLRPIQHAEIPSSAPIAHVMPNTIGGSRVVVAGSATISWPTLLLRSRRDGRPRDEASPSPLNGERAGVRGEKLKKRPISPADLQADRPHLTLLSPLPPGAEREDGRAFVVHPTVCSASHRMVTAKASGGSARRAACLPAGRPSTARQRRAVPGLSAFKRLNLLPCLLLG
jgi:hypothetical protein